MTREKKIAEARQLREKGLTAPEIAEQLGHVSASTVRNWYLGATCECGAPTDGSSKRAQESKQCKNCYLESHSTLERDERVRKLWEEGISSADIGHKLGLTAESVRGIVQNNLRTRRGIPVTFDDCHRLKLASATNSFKRWFVRG